MKASPQYRYPLEEFVEAVDFVRSRRGQHSADPMRDLMTYFCERYPAEPEARYKWVRFYKAFAYFTKHIEAWSEFSVRSERRVLISKPLVTALWEYFSVLPDSRLGDEPTLETLTARAKEIAVDNGNNL